MLMEVVRMVMTVVMGTRVVMIMMLMMVVARMVIDVMAVEVVVSSGWGWDEGVLRMMLMVSGHGGSMVVVFALMVFMKVITMVICGSDGVDGRGVIVMVLMVMIRCC